MMKKNLSILFALLLLLLLGCGGSPKIKQVTIDGVRWYKFTLVPITRDGIMEGADHYEVRISRAEDLRKLEGLIKELQKSDPSPKRILDYRAQLQVVYDNGDSTYLGIDKMHYVEFEGEVYGKQGAVVEFLREHIPKEKIGPINPVISEQSADFLREEMEWVEYFPGRDMDSLVRVAADSLLGEIPDLGLEPEMEKECKALLEFLLELHSEATMMKGGGI